MFSWTFHGKVSTIGYLLLFFLLMTSGFIYYRRYVLVTYYLYTHNLTYVWTYFVSDSLWFGRFFTWQALMITSGLRCPHRCKNTSSHSIGEWSGSSWPFHRYQPWLRCMVWLCWGCTIGSLWFTVLRSVWCNNSSIHPTSRGLQCLCPTDRAMFAMICVCPSRIHVLWLLWEARVVPASWWECV